MLIIAVLFIYFGEGRGSRFTVTNYFHTPVPTLCMHLLLCLIRKCLESFLTMICPACYIFIGDPIFFQLLKS